MVCFLRGSRMWPSEDFRCCPQLRNCRTRMLALSAASPFVFHPVTKQRPAGLTGSFTAIPISPNIEASALQEFRL